MSIRKNNLKQSGNKLLVSIIIPTYNRKQEVMECLKSLRAITYPYYEIIVVDNKSTDDTVSSVKHSYPDVTIVRLPKNKGAVGGRNVGIQHAKGSYLLFLDSDNVVDKNFLSALVDLMESDLSIGFAGPKMYYKNSKKIIWYAGVSINLLTSKTRYLGIGEKDHGQYDSVREVDHIPNCWMVRKSVIEKIGVMDEIYVMTYGEADWPMRAKKAGYKVMFCPKAVVYHDIPVRKKMSVRSILGFDTPYRIYYIGRNRTIFMKKFAHPAAFWAYLLLFLPLFVFQYIVLLIFFGQFRLLVSLVKGTFDGLIKGLAVQRIK